MITINLLAPGKRRAPSTPRVTIAVAGSAAAILIVVIAFALSLSSRAARLHAQLRDVDRQLETLRPVAQEVDRMTAVVKGLEARQARLKELLATQLPASVSLLAVRAAIPSDVWLVNVTTQGGGHSILFDGYTFTYKSVARFMVALRDSGRFRDVDLTSTSKDTIADHEVVKFQITGNLVAGPEKAGAPATRSQTARPGTPTPGRGLPRMPE